MENIEKLRLEMPLVFEMRDNLVRQVAEETADYHLKIDRLRETLGADEFERQRERAYYRFADRLAPVRAHIEAIDKKIAEILAAMHPQQIIVPR